MKYIFQLTLIALVGVLIGCDPHTQSKSIDIIFDQSKKSDTPGKEQLEIQVYEPTEELLKDISNTHATSTLPPLEVGEFKVEFDGEIVTIYARQAVRQKILLDLASKLKIAVRLSESVPGLIDLETFEGSAVDAIQTLLDGMAYSVDYIDRSPSALPQINAVSVGHLAKSFAGIQAGEVLPVFNDNSESDTEMALGFPYSREDAIDTSQKIDDVFLYGGVEEMLEIVNEIELTSAGVRILSDQLRRNPHTEVRIEIINALSNSDAFASKWLVINGLKDTNESVVIAALEAIDIWQDPSTVPYVKAVLQRTRNPKIVELAESIIEYNSDLDTVSFINQSPAEAENATRLAIRRAQQAFDQHSARNTTGQKSLQRKRSTFVTP